MATSQVPVVYAEILDRLTAAVDGADREVIDGPRVEGDETRSTVYVGWSGDLGDDLAVEFEQDWRGLGAGKKSETIAVRCAVVCWSGDDDPAALGLLRAEAFAVFALVETALRPADKSFGLPSPTRFNLSAGQYRQEPGGQRVRIPFTVSIDTRI